MIFIFFVSAYLYFEVQGEMFGSARFLFAIMIFVSLYGMAKYKKNIERDCFKKYFGELALRGHHSGVLHIRLKGSKDFGNRKAIKQHHNEGAAFSCIAFHGDCYRDAAL